MLFSKSSKCLACFTLMNVLVTSQAPQLEGAYMVEDNESSEHFTAICPGTENDDIDVVISESKNTFNFFKLVLFRPGSRCRVLDNCLDNIYIHPHKCTYCGYHVKESSVFASISRNWKVQVYKCQYPNSSKEIMYFVEDIKDTSYAWYRNCTIGVSTILGCVLLVVLVVLLVLLKRIHGGNCPQLGTSLCCRKHTTVARAEDSETPNVHSVVSYQESHHYDNDVNVYDVADGAN